MTARCKPKQDEFGKYIANGAAAKAGLNKAILDASWGELKQKVRTLSEKAGVIFHEVNPRFSSQECSCCGYISPTNRSCEKFLCESCGYLADADVDAAIVIRQRGLDELGIDLPKLPVVHGKVTPKKLVARPGKPLGLPDGSGKPQQYLQLSLLDLLESRKGAQVSLESPGVSCRGESSKQLYRCKSHCMVKPLRPMPTQQRHNTKNATFSGSPGHMVIIYLNETN